MKFKFICREKSRHGKTVYYFRRCRSSPRIRLPDDPDSTEFREAYFLALEKGVAPKRPTRETFETKRKRAVGNALQAGMKAAKQRSTGGKREFNLDIDWLLGQVESQDFRCALTGIPFFSPIDANLRRHPFSPSIDRIDCRRGYTKDNVRIVTAAVNIMLADWGEAVFNRVANCYRNNKNRTSIPAPETRESAPKRKRS